ncbi:inositol polyphosphate 5-phosphatase [Gamsiella multidivaricata]|nr:inositol polyphosphate 5-phosphatase [Gamsiella multidivaricata]
MLIAKSDLPKAPSQQEILQLQMDKEHMLRTSGLSVHKRIVKKDLDSLLRNLQTVSDDSATVRSSGSVRSSSTFPAAKRKPRTIVLDENSDNDAEQDSDLSQEYMLWKLSITKAVLTASISKDKQRGIMRDLKAPSSISLDRRLEIERILQMSPLSTEIQNMSLEGDMSQSASASTQALSPQKPTHHRRRSLTSLSKLQRPDTIADFLQFKDNSRRRADLTNRERRRKLDEDAKMFGTFVSSEDRAAEQMEAEQKQNRGLGADEDEDEEDANGADGDAEDYDGDYEDGAATAAISKAAQGDVEDMEFGSADEAQEFSEESDDDQAGNDLKVRIPSNEKNEVGEESEAESEDEGETGDKTLKTKRQHSKHTAIDDDDDIKVVSVDRSQAQIHFDNEDDSKGSDGNDDEGDKVSGSEDSDNEDVSDLEGTMNDKDKIQGLGHFHSVSHDLYKFKKQPRDQKTIQDFASTESCPISITSEKKSSQPLSGVLDLLSGNFATSSAKPQSSDADVALAMVNSENDDGEIPIRHPRPTDASIAPTGGTHTYGPGKPENAFDVLSKSMQRSDFEAIHLAPGLRRLQKREPKHTRIPISKNEKSAFIEYEAEEEEDEFMGMGGIDYESENEQDEYDLDDGMVDTSTALDSQDVENVRQLHMKHEQDQHEKDISDLVHGIAAGNLWKRRHGQGDDLDLFDEGDMDGRFQRKKKLKVSEKFEKLADNPNTAAFAKAFQKHVDDDQMIFLSDPDDSDHEAETTTKDEVGTTRSSNDDIDDQEMEDVQSETRKSEKARISLGQKDVQQRQQVREEEDEDEEEDEPLNTDKRKERLHLARLYQYGGQESLDAAMASSKTIAAMTKGQTLPFDIKANESTTRAEVEPAATATTLDDRPAKDDPIDEFKETIRRSKTIRDIMEGVDDHAELASQSSISSQRISSLTSNILTRIIDRPSLIDSSGTAGPVQGSVTMLSATDENMQVIAQPRMGPRQNSSFMSGERRSQFLSTVGDESRGLQGGGRVVKEVNRRRMAFATTKKTASSVSLLGTTTTMAIGTTSTTASTSTSTSASLVSTTEFRRLQSAITSSTTVASTTVDTFIALVTGCVKVGDLRLGETVYRIVAVKFFSLTGNTPDEDMIPAPYNPETASENEGPTMMPHPCRDLEKVLCNGAFFFSPQFDLTRSIQSRALKLHEKQSAESNLNYDERFLWNMFMLKELLVFRSHLDEQEREELDSGGLLVHIIQGYVGCQPFRTAATQGQISVISRLSSKRAVFWEQEGLQLASHKIQLSRGSEATKPAVRRHFEELIQKYEDILILDLLGTKDQGEITLSQEYRSQVEDLGPLLRHLHMTRFDYHSQVKGGNYEQIMALLNHVRGASERYGYFYHDLLSNTIVQTQRGVFRTSCLDCLDRQAVELLLHNVLPQDSRFGSLMSMHSELWADNGDLLSKIYTGTGALKSEVTRSGKMSFAGMLGDATKSLNRFVINNFQDKDRQEVIDLLLGKMSHQRPVAIHDPVHDSIESEMKARIGEYSQKIQIDVFVGTYNLNGKLPSGDSLDAWLCFDKGM